MATTLNVCSFNCKNSKTSITELNDLCTNHDFILLQETWLSRPELRVVLQYYGKNVLMPTAPLNVMTVTELWV